MFIPLITQHIKSNVRFSFGTESTSSSSLGQFWTINYRFIEGNNSKNYWPAKRRRNKKDFVWKWFSLKLMVTIFNLCHHQSRLWKIVFLALYFCNPRFVFRNRSIHIWMVCEMMSEMGTLETIKIGTIECHDRKPKIQYTYLRHWLSHKNKKICCELKSWSWRQRPPDPINGIISFRYKKKVKGHKNVRRRDEIFIFTAVSSFSASRHESVSLRIRTVETCVDRKKREESSQLATFFSGCRDDFFYFVYRTCENQLWMDERNLIVNNDAADSFS